MNKNTKMAQSIVGSSEGRPELDFYPTPSEVTRALLSVEYVSENIWECACGKGDISSILINDGLNVCSTDIFDYGYPFMSHKFDFLIGGTPTPFTGVDYDIITNPPFKLMCEFIKTAIYKTDAKKIAFLGKLSTLEGQVRSQVLQETKLTRVHVFSDRIQLTRNGEPKRNGGMIAFAWFVWERGYEGEPKIGWVNSKEFKK